MSSAMISKVSTENFETWKRVYDENEAIRRELGVRGVMIARDASNPNLVMIVTRFDSVDAAKKMLASDAWKAAAKKAGGPPSEVHFTDVVDERTY